MDCNIAFGGLPILNFVYLSRMNNRMRLRVFFILMPVLFSTLSAQIDRFPGKGQGGDMGGRIIRPGSFSNDTSTVRQGGENERHKRKLKTYPLSQYRFYLPEGDTTVIDTLMGPRNHYTANFMQRDLFGFMPFQNIGQPLNVLGIEWERSVFGDLVPLGKAGVLRGKNLLYYHVPTPYSKLFFLTGNNQGQMLDSRFGTNITEDWNLGVGYRGLSSLGYYRHSVSDQERWFFNTERRVLKNRIQIRFYMVKNHFENDENGGLTDENIFTNPGSQFLDRGRIPVKSEQDLSIWHSRETGFEVRTYLRKHDSVFQAGYAFDYWKAYYAYKGEQAGDFGEKWTPYSKDFDSIGYRDYRHDFYVRYEKGLLQVRSGVVWRRFFQTFDSIAGDVGRQHFRLENTIYLEGKQKAGDVQWNVNASYELQWKQGRLTGAVAYGRDIRKIWFSVSRMAVRPRPVFELWQSRFKKFTWNHNFGLTQLTSVEWGASYAKSHVKLAYNQAKNSVYFGVDSLPHSWVPITGLFSAEAKTDIHKGRFGVYVRVRYQLLTGNSPFDAPRWTARGMLYYTDFWFKKHMWMIAGISADWFSPFHLAGYNPLLNEFFVQNNRIYGNFYLADIFFDFKVKKFRAYLKWSHFNAMWERYRPAYFSAPGYPYADAFIRLGISWEFVN